MNEFFSIKDKIALITGATGYLGKSIAKGLAKSGALVYLNGRNEKKVNELIVELEKQNLKVKAAVFDVTNKSAMTDLNEEIKQKHGNVSILVNNAGITMDNLLIRMSENEWSDVIETNLTSIYRITKEFVKDMMKARYGRVINIGSVVGVSGNPGQTNYSATKSALLGFTKSLAKEVASRNITINTVSPGFIDTDMTKKLKDAQREALVKSIPVGRMGLASELANVVGFLASEKSSYITGENINVNGGLYM